MAQLTLTELHKLGIGVYARHFSKTVSKRRAAMRKLFCKKAKPKAK